jgi:hypothetical protein
MSLVVLTTAAQAARFDSDPWWYGTFSEQLIDLDEFFAKSLKWQTQSCQFNVRGGRSFHHPGLGRCLFRNYRTTDTVGRAPGVIVSKIVGPRGNTFDAQIQWAPMPYSNWTLAWFYARSQFGEAKPPAGSEEFLGELNIRFLRGVSVYDVFPEWIATIILGASGGSTDIALERIDINVHTGGQTGNSLPTRYTARVFALNHSGEVLRLVLDTDANIFALEKEIQNEIQLKRP